MTPRHNQRSAGARLCQSAVCISFLFFVATAPAAPGPNNWIKPSSGDWQEPTSWSQGVLPDATQDVSINNTNWKAVAIGQQTALNFSSSMTVQSLFVGAPTNSFNTLLMNFSGFEKPLRTGSLTVGANGAVMVLSSALEVTNDVQLGGSFVQGDFSPVRVHGRLGVGGNSPGTYFMTNGSLTVDMTEFIGAGFTRTGKFVQYGGTNRAGNIDINIDGELDVYGGQVSANDGIEVGEGDFATLASFFQYGGSVNADTVINGNYTLNGGTISGNMTIVSATFQRVDAHVTQSGGTNWATSLDMGHPNRFGGRGFYTLSNGVINVATSAGFHGGDFTQFAGRHTIASNLFLVGTDLGFNFGFARGNYFLFGGTLSAANVIIQASTLQQHDGSSNTVAGDITITGEFPRQFQAIQNPLCDLQGGYLSASNISISPFFGGFTQTGGTNQIFNKLSLQGTNIAGFEYSLGGGTLLVKDILVCSNTTFLHTNGNIVHSGILTLNQGGWQAATGDRSLGPLLLTGELNTNSTITFPGGNSILRLANSSGQPWSAMANLVINNWHGSASGGGQSQLYFGSNASGLTSPQVARIKFAIGGGLQSARILATGEVVPQGQALAFSSSGNLLTMTWEPGWTLQSSTNVTGPYQDVQGATSPYPTSTSNPRQFFRLRQ